MKSLGTAYSNAIEPLRRNAGTGVSSLALAADRGLIVLIVLSLYGLLMQHYPIIYGGDPITRLMNSSRILNGHQLPLLQILINGTMRWYHTSKSIFLLMALISSAACAGLHALAWEITHDRRAARLAALFYITHPFILYYSRVPYQEPLLTAGVAWGFCFLFRHPSASNRLLSSLFFGAACFSRYEGWIAALWAALYQIWKDRRQEEKTSLSSVIGSLISFGWAPAMWLVWNRNLSPPGSYVLDLGLHWARLYRPFFIIKSALWWTESVVVLAASIGFARSWLEPRLRNEGRFFPLAGSLVLLLSALVLSGHGIEPDAERIVTERESFLVISVLVLYAGLGGSWLIGVFRESCADSPLLRFGLPFLAVAVAAGYSLDRGVRRVEAANADPELKTDYEVARFLVERQAGSLILASPLPAEPLANYLKNVEKWEGPRGREEAVQFLKKVETTPLDYQRVLTFSWMGKDKVFSGDALQGFDRPRVEGFLRERHIHYLIIFSDFTPVKEHERVVTALIADHQAPELVINNRGKSARIYAIES
ncbi:MAG TPA: hypothetical protein VE398_23875 [Acidobacteriota bacterium]|nr:hypothetical protein [Acidobacteriota bacterium]